MSYEDTIKHIKEMEERVVKAFTKSYVLLIGCFITGAIVGAAICHYV